MTANPPNQRWTVSGCGFSSSISLITRFRSRCSQLHTHPLIIQIQYSVLVRRGSLSPQFSSLSRHQKWVETTGLAQLHHFKLFIKKWKGGEKRLIFEGKPVLQEALTQPCRVIAWGFHVREIEKRRARVCAHDGDRKLCVIRLRARARKLPNALWCGLMWWQKRESSSLRISLVLMMTLNSGKKSEGLET